MKTHLQIFSAFYCVTLALILLHQTTGFAQPLTGTKTIPGDYATIAAAITDLNLKGVGAGGVTFTIAAGYTETFSNQASGRITATGTSGNPVVFQKSGAGANPVITAGTGTGNMDGIIVLSGTDYITFDGIDVKENVTNTDTLKAMEYGFALLKKSILDGCQHVTIKNCSVTLTTAYSMNYKTGSGTPLSFETYPIGIYTNNHTTTSSLQLPVAGAGGTNSYNQFDGNTISGVWTGIRLCGYASASFYDQNNKAGGDSGNTISTVSTGNAESYGIIAYNQLSAVIAGNNISTNNSNNTSVGVHGIITYGGTDLDIYNNTIKMTIGGSGGVLASTAISNQSTTGTVNIHDNTIEDLNWTQTVSGATFNAIRNNAGCNNLAIYNNVIKNNTVAAGGPYNSRMITVINGPVVNTLKIYGNIITGNNITGGPFIFSSFNTSALTQYEIHDNQIYDNNIKMIAGTGIQISLANNPSVYSNSIYNNTTTSVTAAMSGITFAGTGSPSIYQNNIYGLSSMGGAVTGISSTGAGNTISIYKNTIHHLSNTGTANTVSGINLTAGATAYIYNNMVYDLEAESSTAVPSVAGIGITGGSAQQVYYNTVFLNGSSLVDGHKTGALYITSGAVNMRNNIFYNNYSPSGAGSIAAAIYKSTSGGANLATGSNNNLVYAGTPGVKKLLFYDGTNSIQDITAYKSLLTPKESGSVTGDPVFINAASPYDVHIDSSASPAIDAGTPVVNGAAGALLTISTDIDGDTRNAVTPTIGADEGEAYVCNAAAGTISASRDTICEGTAATLTAAGSTGILQWESSVTGNNFTLISGTSGSSYISAPAQTTYYRVIAGGGACADTSDLFRLIVTASPHADFNYSKNNSEVTFSNSSQGATIYDWNFGDSTTSHEPNPVHTYSAQQIYHSCLTAYNGSNCSSTICRDIDMTTGIKPVTATARWKIYPVPFADKIYIEGETPLQVQLYDALGRCLMDKTPGAGHLISSMDTGMLPPGIYFLKIKTSESVYTLSLTHL